MKTSLLAALAALVSFAAFDSLYAGDRKLKVECTTYPIYQTTRNVVQGSDALDVRLLIPANTGCPHDYSLTPQDVKKISEADVIVVNGLGMETFLGTPIRKANANVKVVDSSAGIKDLLQYSMVELDQDKPEALADDEHKGINPHLFASPRMNGKLALNIGAAFAKIDPANAQLYLKNAEDYAAKMNKLNEEFVALAPTLKNKKVVMTHGIFDYLTRDMGVEVVAVLREYEEEMQEPSAGKIIEIAKTIKVKGAGAIFTEPSYPDKVAKMIGSETGVPVAKLDPVNGGPENVGLDYYEKTMRANLETMKQLLGGK